MAGFRIPVSHPALAGHFPGFPVIPGVVLLERALALIGGGPPGAMRLETVKFLAPVFPGQAVAVAAEQRPDGRLAFACHVGGKPVLRGLAVLDPRPGTAG